MWVHTYMCQGLKCRLFFVESSQSRQGDVLGTDAYVRRFAGGSTVYPHSTILYHTIPYHTILYYTILYYTILYYCIDAKGQLLTRLMEVD